MVILLLVGHLQNSEKHFGSVVNQLPHTTWKNLYGDDIYQQITDSSKRTILITGHRRENLG